MVNPLFPLVILFSPLIACVLITLFTLKHPKLSSLISVCGILFSLVLCITWFIQLQHSPASWPLTFSYPWAKSADLEIPFGFYIDPFSLLMLLVVTGVSSTIFLYSIGYMKEDPGYSRYFAYLALFAFSMIGVVLADNFVMLFIFWELVAVSSYLLIGFWYEKPSAADAGNKAFIVNRIADFGFLAGIFTVWTLSGASLHERTFQFSELSTKLPLLIANGTLSSHTLFIASLLIFCGVLGKSAQFPLHVWLPDAMEGPTPVSALIHAATMVAAGVYLLCRTFFLIGSSPEALSVIATIGCITAFLAALLAIVQDDIKKVLAYSTISQLGYMVLALGLGSSVIGMYHLTTHAFFKALLFLAAGSFIHSLHTQDIWEMGNSFKRLPLTSSLFLIGTLALCGIFPLSGFFSKDEILLLAHSQNKTLFYTILLTAGLTAFYMTRTVWVAIFRKTAHHHDHAHEAPLVMWLPMSLLAILSVTGGFLGIPGFLSQHHGHHEAMNRMIALSSTAMVAGGILLALFFYLPLKSPKDPLKESLKDLHHFLSNKLYLDDLYFWGAGNIRKYLAGFFEWNDWSVIIKVGVNGSAGLAKTFGDWVRKAQTGRIETYTFVFLAGLVSIVYLFIFKGQP